MHGSEGSLIATNVMTQKPVGEVLLRSARGEEMLSLSPEDLYHRSVRNFVAASPHGAALRSGEDGIKSMAVALAALKAAKTAGRRRSRRHEQAHHGGSGAALILTTPS